MEKPAHRKNPAAVALGRLGGLAGRGKAKARKITSAMARKAVLARWAKYKASLPLLCVLLLAGGESAFCQGSIFLYTFSGDDSPLHVSASFSATREAVASRTLTETNIFNSRVLLGDGRTAPIDFMYFPVLPPEYGGTPVFERVGQYLKAFASFGMDYIAVRGGAQGFKAEIDFYPWVGYPQGYTSAGKWEVTAVPEPSSLSLLLLATCLVIRDSAARPNSAR